MEDNQQSRVVIQVVRYGLALVVAIFYFSASRGFEYTPDSTFLSLQYARGLSEGTGLAGLNPGPITGTPNPLWVFFVAAGHWLHLDILITCKVFSLFFCCLALLATYLLTFEVLSDRLLAFCVALVVGMESSFLQVGPSGSALAMGLALSLGGIFFLLRNEYLLASLLAGLCTLIFWEAVGLLLFVLFDVLVNSVRRSRAYKVMFAVVLVYCSVLLPWVLYAIGVKVPLVPSVVPVGEYALFTAPQMAVALILFVLLVSGLTLILRRGIAGRMAVRGQAAPLLWILWLVFAGIAGEKGLWFFAMPLLVLYAFYGMRHLLHIWNFENALYTAGFSLAGILLLLNQIVFAAASQPVMARTIEESTELLPIAIWLKGSTPENATVSAEKPWQLGFYWGKQVEILQNGSEPHCEFVVSSRSAIDGYHTVYAPLGTVPDVSGNAHRHFAVWKRNNSLLKEQP